MLTQKEGLKLACLLITVKIISSCGAAVVNESTSTSTSVSVTAASLLSSNAHRDAALVPFYIGDFSYSSGIKASRQLTLAEEVESFGQAMGGSLLPITLSYSYRDIPDISRDNDGATGISITYALRPPTACGNSGKIATRIADCAAKNGTRASWNGAEKGNAGQALWKLVFTTGQTTPNSCAGNDCREVWQDTRTGLLWSSLARTSASTTPINTNWCQASGNVQLSTLNLVSANNGGTSPLIGNGTISNISTGGSSAVTEGITVTFGTTTSFTVSGTNCGNSPTANLGPTAASTSVTYSKAGFCSFTLTQGSTSFGAGDTFKIVSGMATIYSCNPSASSLQPATGTTSGSGPVSFCAEGISSSGDHYYSGFPGDSTYYAPSSGNPTPWNSNATITYDASKGRMGRNSTYPVYWRLPNLYDYEQADIDGIRFVMPDMGVPSEERAVPDGSLVFSSVNEWAASLYSKFSAGFAFYFNGLSGGVASSFYLRKDLMNVRCVGR